ncbi:hypothetical protein PM082_007325 [Marasmius tenuissimus]|nr:hypothetical protein PM082_007325 [Marasmius tenuissimus]
MAPKAGYENTTALHPRCQLTRNWAQGTLAQYQNDARTNVNGNRDTTPARSEATPPPDTIIGENDQNHLLTDDRSEDEAIKTGPHVNKLLNQDGYSPVADPEEGPNKRVRTSLHASTRPTYGPPKTPQKRKTTVPPTDSRHQSALPSPAQPNGDCSETPLPFSNSTINGRNLYGGSEASTKDNGGSQFTYLRNLSTADDDIEMEDDTADTQRTSRATPRTIKFDLTPVSFATKKARKPVTTPNGYLPPRNYSAMPPAFLEALGHVSRNEDGTMPIYLAAIEHWQKNANPEVIKMVYSKPGWITLHMFDGGSLQRLMNAENKQLEAKIKKYILSFPDITKDEVKLIMCEPRCHYLASNNKHAPPHAVFTWIDNARVQGTILHLQTHDVSDLCTFHATHVNYDAPSHFVMNICPTLPDEPEEMIISTAESTASDSCPTDVKVYKATQGIKVQLYRHPADGSSTTELSVFFKPLTDDYRLSQEAKEYFRINHTKFKYRAHSYKLLWEHHKGATSPLFCTLCLLDDHPVPRCPFPYIHDWQGPGIDHSLTTVLKDKGVNVQQTCDEAYVLAVSQGQPIHPEDGYESEEKIALNSRRPGHFRPPAVVQARTKNRYSATVAGPSSRVDASDSNQDNQRCPKTMARPQNSTPSFNPGFGSGYGQGTGRDNYHGRGHGGRGRGRGW